MEITAQQAEGFIVGRAAPVSDRAPDVVFVGNVGEGIGIRGLPGGGVEIFRCKGDEANGSGVYFVGTAECPIDSLLPTDPIRAFAARSK